MIRRRRDASLFGQPVLTGTIIIVALLGVVYLSYTAQNGLPFQRTYALSVEVPDASEMTKNSDVRIGGARVGQVLRIDAQPAGPGHPPYARLAVVLSRSLVSPLPIDSTSRVRLASLLGGKYLELTPGAARATITSGGTLGLARSAPIVDLDQAFRAFGGRTATAFQGTIHGLGDALAGRGAALNRTIGATATLLAPLTRVLRTLTSSRTGLPAFIDGAAAAASALAPLGDRLGALLDHAGTTFDALAAGGAGGPLGRALDRLAPTEATGTRTLRDAQPALSDAAALAQGLLPAARLLPAAATQLDAAIRATTPVLRRAPALAAPLGATFAAVARYASDPAARASIAALRGHDFVTFTGSLFLGLGGVVRYAADAQLHCNVLGIWARNVASIFSDGDPAGSWLTFSGILSQTQSMQVATPSADLHFDPYPREDAHACQAGNEVYGSGQAIGPPAATSGTGTDQTAGPATRAR